MLAHAVLCAFKAVSSETDSLLITFTVTHIAVLIVSVSTTHNAMCAALLLLSYNGRLLLYRHALSLH
jgi:hypothetical protein